MVKNREAEKEIMKDVPGWVAGTYFGTPIYYRKGLWANPAMEEYYAHADYDKGYEANHFVRHYH